MNAEVKKIIAKGQTETTEFRGARTPVESLSKSICGMLNQQGGTIVVGVSDQRVSPRERLTVLNSRVCDSRLRASVPSSTASSAAVAD